jgi:thiol:disulfide interchange protein DsbD
MPLCANTSFAQAVTTKRTEVTLLSEVKTVHEGQKFWVMLHIHMQPGWHTYWKNPGDSGTSPELTWTLPKGFAAGDIQYLAPDRLKTGPLVDYGYNNDSWLPVVITPPAQLNDKETAILALKARWLVCKDVCVPESGDFSLALPATSGEPERSSDAAQIADRVNALPVPATHTFAFAVEGDNVHFVMPLSAQSASQIKMALFFPARDGFITNAADQKVSVTPGALSFVIAKGDGPVAQSTEGLISVFLTSGDRKDYEVHLQAGTVAAMPLLTEPVSNAPAGGNIFKAVLYAFLGGLILNLMPCVFPVLSLKALAVAKKSAAHPRQARRQGIAYMAGVLASFLLLAGVLLALRSGGNEIGWGFQMQSPIFVASLSLLLFVVGLNLSGYFELPVIAGNVGGHAASREGVLGSFLTGVLAVAVATPCTAPFMAPAVGFALTQAVPVVLTIFTVLGFGLGAPFLCISLFPRLIRLLPKPGAWMQTFKEFLAFPMYGWSVWLLWVLAREAGADPASAVLLAMVLIAFAIWLCKRHSAVPRFAGMFILVMGLFSALAVTYAHPAGYDVVHTISEPFSTARLDALRKSGKPVFVDATADWCITCKVNETVALSSRQIMRAFRDRQITYLVADWTHGDEDITRYLESFGRSGVPIYVYYAPRAQPVVLPQILTASIVMKAIGQ